MYCTYIAGPAVRLVVLLSIFLDMQTVLPNRDSNREGKRQKVKIFQDSTVQYSNTVDLRRLDFENQKRTFEKFPLRELRVASIRSSAKNITAIQINPIVYCMLSYSI